MPMPWPTELTSSPCRIAPLPPHWFVNIVAPHLDISVRLFWVSTFLGVMAVSFIHVQIGTTLDQITNPGDFHLISVSVTLYLMQSP